MSVLPVGETESLDGPMGKRPIFDVNCWILKSTGSVLRTHSKTPLADPICFNKGRLASSPTANTNIRGRCCAGKRVHRALKDEINLAFWTIPCVEPPSENKTT